MCGSVYPNHILGGTRHLDVPNLRGFEEGFCIFLFEVEENPKTWVATSSIEPGMPDHEEESLDLAVDQILRIYREGGKIP